MDLAFRFWRKVAKGKPDECWEWQGHRERGGYGTVAFRKAKNQPYQKLAHRVAWELSNTADIPDGMFVCHTCDNPPCCNPNHLWLGTQADNNRDMIQKGRYKARIPVIDGNATIKTFAKLAGTTRATIYRGLKDGRLHLVGGRIPLSQLSTFRRDETRASSGGIGGRKRWQNSS